MSDQLGMKRVDPHQKEFGSANELVDVICKLGWIWLGQDVAK